MTDRSWFGLIISIVLVIGVLSAGCSGDTASPGTPVPTTPAILAKYAAGDIVATTATAGDSSLYLILQYDKGTDLYTRAFIDKNTDGSWGHRTNNRTETSPRTVVEKVYPVKVAHVSLSSVPIVTMTIPPATVTTSSASAPTVRGISPASGAKDAVVSVTINGTNFQNGAVVRLVQPGSSPVTATGVSVTSTEIDCVFNLYGHDAGTYNVIVTNPDGQSDTRADIFTIGDAPPIISGVNPSTGELNDTPSLTIYGQNFKDGVKVTLTLGTSEIVCLNPVAPDSTRILCNLNLKPKSGGPAVGSWDLTVLNIDGQQKGIWPQKFVITNSTTS
jgi:hypothetical protein